MKILQIGRKWTDILQILKKKKKKSVKQEYYTQQSVPSEMDEK